LVTASRPQKTFFFQPTAHDRLDRVGVEADVLAVERVAHLGA